MPLPETNIGLDYLDVPPFFVPVTLLACGGSGNRVLHVMLHVFSQLTSLVVSMPLDVCPFLLSVEAHSRPLAQNISLCERNLRTHC